MTHFQVKEPPHGANRTLRGWLTRLVAIPLLFVLTSGVAWAYWTVGSEAGGKGASAAADVNQGATPTVSSAGNAVTVSWAASTLSNGTTAVAGYLVKRYDVTLTSQPILSACTGTVAATACTETSVPAGMWTYSVTPVFATSWRGAESLPSSAVTVAPSDGTPPVNAITMSVGTGSAFKSTNTIFYRGSVAGSFTLTNAVSDSGSGPASSTTSSLTGTTTGWAHTASTVATPPGGPFRSNLFSWTSATATLGEVVTGRDVAGNTAATTLSLVNDSTAPSADTIAYSNTYQAGRSVAVTFTTTGTDSGSGIATRQLQRSSAPLTGGSCGSLGGFADVGPANPTSPYADPLVTNGVCYQYRYVVTDRVGNQAIATSTSVSRVDYAGAVSATPGLLSHWRLGESAATLISSDSFTGPAGKLLAGHTGQVPIGATWVKATSTNSLDETISDANDVYRNGAGYSFNYTTATPPNADYSVAADLVVKSILPLDTSPVTGDSPGVVGRSTETSAGPTGYMARWEQATTSWNIIQFTDITATYLSSVKVPALTPGQTYRLRLDMSGTSPTMLKLSVNGVLITSYTDTTTPLTAIGRAGIRDGIPGSTVIKRVDTGIHYDNFQVTAATYPRAADSKGSNTADYFAGPTLGVPGAIAGDTNTAAQFDGVNEHVQAVDTTGIPVGASLRSVEMWFKTTPSPARQVLFNYGTRTNGSEFGLWLDAGGASMTAWGYGPGNDKTFTMPYPVSNGAWHQVVKTYNGTSITLYIDGVALPSRTATRTTVMDPYGFGIGAVIVPGDNNSGGYFNGSLDEVSFYTTPLDQATVTNHYQLGTLAGADVTGPTGGSVDASGLVGTGPRYAASTTLNLSFSKGTDPSGVAATGAELWRATALLTSAGGADGVCGTFGSFTQVTGGADSSPRSDTVADQACYRYRYVVADTLGNPTTYTSPDVKVDTTSPAAPSLSFSAFTNTYWSLAAPSVVYRSAAATGSFTATAAAIDTGSGIAGYVFPSLSTGTSTPGTLGVNTYSWTVSPAGGTKNVTATNNATGISSYSPFTLTADTTAPTPGTVTYLDGTTTGTTVDVTFATGTDGGSGVGTRAIQRQSATLTGTTCGTFGAFSTLTNGTNPSSHLVDTVTPGNCYKYQYVVSDNVGNQGAAATSTSVAKVASPLSYLATITGETSLVNYWRLGETTTSDPFTGTTGATLQSQTGTTWTKHTVSGTTDAVITAAGRIRKNGPTWGALYYSSAVPGSADYTVEADVYVRSILTDDLIGIAGRLDPANANVTCYAAVYDRASAAWILYSVVNGVPVLLGQSTSQSLAATTTYRLALDMTGSTIRLLVNGVQQVSVVNATIAAAGRAGVILGFGAANTTVTETTGMHLDNFKVTPPLADSKGTNHGDYLNGPTLGVTGGITGDSNTAAQFDGVNDYGTVARQISDDFSIEFWFKSTQGIGVNNKSWRKGAGLVDAEVNGTANDFGVSLGSDGKVVAGVGGSPDVSIVSSAGYADGAWHHVVFTRTRTFGALQLYLDGVFAGSATGSTASLDTPNISFGRIQAGNNYFAGSLDEVAVYSTALLQSAVTAHYSAGK